MGTQGQQQPKRMAWRIEAAAARAEIYLYEEIGGWGTKAGDFVAELRGLGGKPVDLHVNSGGGDVFDGLAMYNALKGYAAGVTAYVDGLAASAASFIVQAASRIVIAKNASMMIHEAHGVGWGNAEEMQKLAALLDSASENIASIYAERAGGDVAAWRAAMRAETWYRGQEAVDAGLADEVAGESANRAASRPAARVLWRPAASAGGGNTKNDDDGQGKRFEGLGEAFARAAAFSPTPQELLVEQLRKESFSAAVAAGRQGGG